MWPKARRSRFSNHDEGAVSVPRRTAATPATGPRPAAPRERPSGLDWSPRPHAPTLSLPEQIAHSIGTAIIGGEYEAGTRILEQEVASRFQVSRGPVREALRILERGGLVQLNARRGAQVAQMDGSELRQIFQVRASLLGLAARLATEQQNESFVKDLKAGVLQIGALARTSDDASAYVAAVTQMNLRLAAASENKYLREIIFALAHQTVRYTLLGLASKERRLQSARNWKRLLEAVVARNAAEAAEAAEDLVVQSRDAALRLIGTNYPKPPSAPRSRK
jgi:DNA-binding GntR family transcriptional regulator